MKIEVDDNYRVFCPCDGEKVPWEKCVDCIAFDSIDEGEFPEWVDCDEKK